MQIINKKIQTGILLLMGTLLLPNELIGQRVFAPSEDGVMIEMKEGSIGSTHWLTLHDAQFPKKMQTMITAPLKIYIYSEEELDVQNLRVQPIINTTKYGKVVINDDGKIYFKRYKPVLQKINPNIYELSVTGDINNAFSRDLKKDKAEISSEIVVTYYPTKKEIKEGKKYKKFFYAKSSQLDYDEDDIQEWSDELAIESINQLVIDGKTTEQLFASIKPQQPQIVNGQQIQYVVVQNNPSNNQQDNNLTTPKEDKKEIVSDVDKNIPYRDINNENTFALIIANEDYNKVTPVNFALRDGQKITEYFKKTLGIEKSHIAYLENATLNDMRYEINRLSKISDAYNGDVSFIIYYIGHGIPDEKNGNGYLLPVDGYGNDVTTAYSLEELYSQLSGLDAKKIILFTDACFSGANKSGDMLIAARGIAIRSNLNEAKGHLIAFSACQGDETAYSYDEQGHGLLTYYFLKKLKETGGQTTLGELEEYIVDNVGKTAIVINGKSQTPRVSVSPELQETWRDQTLFE